MGRYDEMRPGEPARKLTGKKRSFRDNIAGSQQDKVIKCWCISFALMCFNVSYDLLRIFCFSNY